MSNDPMYAITMAAANLKAVAPEQFDRLTEAFKLLESRYQQDFNVAGPDVIFGAQGKTWLAGQIRARLENCHEQRRTYENRT